ncbi:PD-(D/E)XK nuclease-like domain-containing protein [Glycomyces sp. NPDC021274]|uniref:PD-(D/E)XK nuclease-like domain-containing protein n=1 Tax=Glycomyces sp. NPDC021274 TaxID=3155120 RepID=UPI0033C73B6A
MSERILITEPGVYADLDEADYHRDPVPGGSLSSTGARAILPPGTPARFNYERHRKIHKREWDLGTAAHAIALGTGPEIVILDFPDYLTKAAKEARNGARAAGQVPLLTHEYESVMSMVIALRHHEIAGPLLAKDTGAAEQSLFWIDEKTGVWCRARLDWLKPAPTGGRVIVADLKTTNAADEESITKSIANFNYHQQGAFYLDGVRTLGIHPDPAFVLVFVEKTPPHQVHVVQLDAYTLQIAHAKNQRALKVYAECAETNTWPGYPTDITTVSLPPWAERTESEEYLPHV